MGSGGLDDAQREVFRATLAIRDELAQYVELHRDDEGAAADLAWLQTEISDLARRMCLEEDGA